MNIIIPINPIPASRPRVTRWGTHYKEPYRSYKTTLTNYFKEYMKKENKSIIEQNKDVSIDVTYYMGIPKSYSNKKRNSLLNKPHKNRPDLDNLLKATMDAMTDTLITDDNCVYSIDAVKIWSDLPRTHLIITVG